MVFSMVLSMVLNMVFNIFLDIRQVGGTVPGRGTTTTTQDLWPSDPQRAQGWNTPFLSVGRCVRCCAQVACLCRREDSWRPSISSLRTLGISWSKILGCCCCCCCCCCSAAWDRTASNSLKIPSSYSSWMDLKSEIWTRHYHHPASNDGPRLFYFNKNPKYTVNIPQKSRNLYICL